MVFENAKPLDFHYSRYRVHRFSKLSDIEKPRYVAQLAPNFPVFRSAATQPPNLFALCRGIGKGRERSAVSAVEM